jgi:hypothetical protein
MSKWRRSLVIPLLLVFTISFAASVQRAVADGTSLCECKFWCEGRQVDGIWYLLPNGDKECRSDDLGTLCVCYPEK